MFVQRSFSPKSLQAQNTNDKEEWWPKTKLWSCGVAMNFEKFWKTLCQCSILSIVLWLLESPWLCHRYRNGFCVWVTTTPWTSCALLRGQEESCWDCFCFRWSHGCSFPSRWSPNGNNGSEGGVFQWMGGNMETAWFQSDTAPLLTPTTKSSPPSSPPPSSSSSSSPFVIIVCCLRLEDFAELVSCLDHWVTPGWGYGQSQSWWPIVHHCRCAAHLQTIALCMDSQKFTLPETNIAPGNRPSQEEISSSNHSFSGAMLVSGSVPFTFKRYGIGNSNFHHPHHPEKVLSWKEESS